jgi:hypothetical protein
MNYDIQFTDDEERRRIYGELPDDQVEVLEAALRNLANDPHKHSVVPPSPPFRKIGRLFEVTLKPDGRIFYVRFFIHVDKPTKKIAVRRVTIDPPIGKKSAAIEPIGMDELRDVVEIPARSIH